MITGVPRPSSPTKPELRPNPHPYPIKTTSTALLSRSNSSPHNAQSVRYNHHYIPPSPSPSPTRGSPTRPGSKGHRYSKSISEDLPSPLPIPPTREADCTSTDPESGTPSRRSKRADTLPSFVPSPTLAADPLEDLPSNPKQWSPAQLASYLATALRVRSGEAMALPVPVARDIAQFVRESRIAGKTFLRFSEDDFEEMGVNKLWRTALHNAARNLRQNVLRGRVWGFSADAESENENENENNSAPDGRHKYQGHDGDGEVNAHTTNTNPFSSALYNSSTSSVDLSSPSWKRGTYKSGHVKGMVASLERDSSFDSWQGTYGRERSGSTGSLEGHVEVEGQEIAVPCPVHAHDDSGDTPEHSGSDASDSEPTIEALLATAPGAVAWENDFGPRETAKRVPLDETRTQAPAKGGVSAWEDDEVGVTVKHVGERGSERVRARTPGKRLDKLAVQGIFGAAEESAGSASTAPPVVQDTSSADDAVDGAIERQARAMGETRSLLDAFRVRLEEVERKVAGMDERTGPERTRQAQGEPQESNTTNGATRRGGHTQTSPLSLLMRPSLLLAHAIERFCPTPPASAPPRPADGHSLPYAWVQRPLDPTTLTALPSYVLWTGLGVCAVVLRVVVRRLVLGAAKRGAR